MPFLARNLIFIAIAWLFTTSFTQAANMLYGDHPLAGKIWDMNSSSFIDESTLLDRINSSNVLLLGEVHDNQQHHELQQKLLKARITFGAQPALMMEQLDISSQPVLDQALAGTSRDEVLSSVNALIKFTDWEFYSPLLAIAVDSSLPIIAANVPNQYLQPVIWKGYQSYPADELKRLAVEEVWNDKRQNYLVANMGGAHCGQLREELRIGLTRSQRLRDALMADSAVSSVGRDVVAIVGSSHARKDIGLPLYFAARTPAARVYSIGFVEVTPGVLDPHSYNGDSATGQAPYDVMWFTARMEREDPCANYGKHKPVVSTTSRTISKQ